MADITSHAPSLRSADEIVRISVWRVTRTKNHACRHPRLGSWQQCKGDLAGAAGRPARFGARSAGFSDKPDVGALVIRPAF